MDAHTAMADAVMSNIRGMQEAEHLVQGIRDGCASENVLLYVLRQAQATNDAVRLRGFCRELQKAIERSAGSTA